MSLRLLPAIVLLAIFTACSRSPAPPPGVEGPTLRISVLASGELLLDGVVADDSELDARLARVRDQQGMVWYYRANATNDASPEALAVIRRVAAAQVPVSFSMQPDFSDYVDDKGRSHPRN